MSKAVDINSPDKGLNDSAGRVIDESSELSRRDLIKMGAAAAVVASLASNDLAATRLAAAPASISTASPAPLFFAADEFAMVDELSELIIPTDDHSPGARAAKVAEYIDFRLSETLEEQQKTIWHDGLKLIDQLSQEANSKPFMQCSSEQKISILTRISQNEAKPQKPEELFFKELKHRVVGAYYSSEIGIKQEMEYQGNTYLKEFVGFDAT